ncbi:MAG TPA: 50S ribosomal protein L23 [Rhodothermales bacterium]|nr:50S ribosomal protein L23 [Rhodothermales bacterium]
MTKQILIRPYVTEKMTDLMEAGRHYAFVVAKDANKIEIRKAIEAFYPQVKVAEVRTQVVRGKTRRQFTKRGAVAGRRPGYKKAIVTLTPDSEPINFYEEV